MITLRVPGNYFKNIITLFTGILLAQGIQILLFLVLPRLYSPQSFGKLTLMLSVVSILSIMASGKYEQAIVLPKRFQTGISVLKITFLLAFVFCSLLMLIFLLFGQPLIIALKLQLLADWFYVIPLMVLLNILSVGLFFWFTRNREYRLIAKNKVSENVVFGVSAISMGLMKIPIGLVIARFFGQISGVLLYVFKLHKKGEWGHFKSNNEPKLLKATAIRYKKFPKFSMFAGLFNTGAAEVPSFVINYFYGPLILGWWGFANSVATVPLGVISKSVGNVFNEQAAKDYVQFGSCRRVLLKTLLLLIGIGIVPFVILIFYAPQLFALIFGEEWRQAGKYVQILSPNYFFQFISNPVTSVLLIAERQEVDMLIEVFLLIGILSFMLVFGRFHSIELTLKAYTIIYSIYYLTILFLSYYYSSRKDLAWSLKKTMITS
ncbi:hypothetical protein C3K47_13615 [Solitalea longa]|uniref:Polysaccharide biosynthesis protein n=1 Tax=Solitalea longa TaxID=2079460 RepID=A0A2S4ZZL8_9SPHI|nr:oligosaccharide flippase family protein [Solitalea longa]POY35790.1 hypothetical protein C3K47_13615 [Solitalea longa]